MKRKFGLFLILALIVTSIFAFYSCDNKDGETVDNSEKQVPVYQGMTISSAKNSLSNGGVSMLSSISYSSEIASSEVVGDFDGRNDSVDENDPFDSGVEIEEEIEDSLNVIGSPETIYYANPNQDIYINIHIDNPDSFEIMSFTLNGKKYSSYMFEEGSDMETIVLKYNVGAVSGVVEYTIDAIKYVDGTEIKDVLIDGNKTVMAGVKTENQLSAGVSELDIDTNALSFKVNVKDNDNLIAFSGGALKAVLFDGDSIVAEKDLALGENLVEFTSLETNTLYQYAVVAYYDDLSGAGFGMNVLYKDAFYTDSVVLFDNVTIGQESVSFAFHWHEDHQGKAISTLKLYKDGAFVKDITASSMSVSELLSNTTYKLVAEYQNGENTESIYIEFATLAKATPEISITNPTGTQTSVGFEISETDTDNVGAVSKIELVHASGTVVAASLNQRTFENLLSNNAYTVKLTYVYNLNDGKGEQSITKELEITTLAKTSPSFKIGAENIKNDSVNTEYTVSDIDKVLLSYKIELYKNGSLVSENTEKKISFENLEVYSDYAVIITYAYNLNDGNGEQSANFSYDFKTLPYIDVTECDIANTSAVSEGDTIYMSVKLDNPLGMSVESVVINGEIYSVTGSSTKNKIFVEITYNGQFAGGDTYLKVDKVNAKIDSTTLSIEPESELSDNVFINGKLELLKIELVNEDFEPVDWAFTSDKLYVMLTLDNPTGYDLYELTYDSPYSAQFETCAPIKIDDNHWYFDCYMRYGDGWYKYSVHNISYSNAYMNKSLTYSNMEKRFYSVASGNIKYVTNAEDLKDMDDGCYYVLQNDIDLSGLEWLGSGFDGVFEGNGYSIKNMSFVGTVKNTNVRLGLFDGARGIIRNLNLEDALIIAEISSDDSNSCNAYCGGFAARGNVIFIDNCVVDKDSIFNVKNNTNSYNCHVGGFFGESYEVIIANSSNDASISSSSNAGGFVGDASSPSSSSPSVVFTNCTNNGDVSGEDYIGGFVGYSSSPVVFTNCINNGDVSGEDCIGGFAGYASSGCAFTNCTNNGDVSGKSNVGGFAGNASSGCAFTNCINNGDVSGKDHIGGFAGYAGCAFTNCTNNGEVSGEGYIGGFAGYAFGGFTNCTNNGEVSGEGYIGGFAGYASSGGCAFTNCTNNGEVSGEDYIGGFVGEDYSGCAFTNCINNGEVSGEYNIGGFVGGAYSGCAFTNCINNGDVSGFVGYYYSSSAAFTNCYSTLFEDSDNVALCTVEELNTKEFYTETLGWSEDVWDFSELDVENGKYPKLK